MSIIWSQKINWYIPNFLYICLYMIAFIFKVVKMSENKREVWQEWEDLVMEYYEEKWYEILDTNYTIRWWEIDIVVQKDGTIVFVEVKVVDHTDDLIWYITPKKLMYLDRTIQDYMYKKWLNFNIRMDVAFVKNNQILEVYENVTNN